MTFRHYRLPATPYPPTKPYVPRWPEPKLALIARARKPGFWSRLRGDNPAVVFYAGDRVVCAMSGNHPLCPRYGDPVAKVPGYGRVKLLWLDPTP